VKQFSNDIKYDFTQHYDESSSITTEFHSEPKDGMKVSHRAIALLCFNGGQEMRCFILTKFLRCLFVKVSII
jgi:hypothetical protein